MVLSNCTSVGIYLFKANNEKHHPVVIYLFKFNDRNPKRMCEHVEVKNKDTKTTSLLQLVLMFPLQTLNK